MSGDNTSVASGSSYPALDATSPTDSVIQGDFGTLSAQEQERQRDEWKAELGKTEEEIITLRQVLASKEAHAQGLKRRLGITRWREFSEDMTQGLKNLQDSQAYKQAGEAVGSAKAKTASVWSSISNSQSFISASQKMGSAFGAAKTKVTTSFSSQNLPTALTHMLQKMQPFQKKNDLMLFYTQLLLSTSKLVLNDEKIKKKISSR